MVSCHDIFCIVCEICTRSANFAAGHFDRPQRPLKSGGHVEIGDFPGQESRMAFNQVPEVVVVVHVLTVVITWLLS